MSKKKKTVVARSKSTTPRIPEVSEDADRIAQALAEFRRARKFVQPILAGGILVDVEHGYDDLATYFANTLGAQGHEDLFSKHEEFLWNKGVQRGGRRRARPRAVPGALRTTCDARRCGT